MAFPLQFSPGTRFLDIRFSILIIEEFPDHRVAYTNLGYCALALIIEQVWSDHKVGLFVVQFVHFVFGRSKTTTCPTYQTLTDFSSCPPSPFFAFLFILLLLSRTCPLLTSGLAIFLRPSCPHSSLGSGRSTSPVWIKVKMQKYSLPRDLQCRDVPWRGQSKRL